MWAPVHSTRRTAGVPSNGLQPLYNLFFKKGKKRPLAFLLIDFLPRESAGAQYVNERQVGVQQTAWHFVAQVEMDV